MNFLKKKNQCVNKAIKEDIRKYRKTNEKGNTTLQNLWKTPKTVLRGKFIVIQAYLKKQEKSQTKNLTYHLKELEKEEQTKFRVSRRKEINKYPRGNKYNRDKKQYKRSMKSRA